MNKVYIKKQYKTTNAVAIPDYSDSEQAFQLASSPESDMGWIVIAPWTPQEESCFFHRVVGNTVYVHGVNRTNPSLHPIGTLVYYAATIDYLNYIFSQQGNQMFIFKTSDDNVTVLGWEFYKDWDYITIPDLNTSLGLPDKTLLINSTSYIHIIDDEYKILSYRDKTYYYVGSVTTNSSGVITNITQANIKHLSSKWDKGDQWDQWEKGDTGDYGVNYQWEFNINTLYTPRDVVLENGQLYICIADSLGNGVNDPLYWDLFLPKSEIVIGLQQERFVNTTSSTLELTGNPFDSDSVYVFIRQRKGVDGVDYTFNIATGVITLIGSSISTTPQTIEVLYSTTGTAGPTTIDWDNINNKPLQFSPSAHSHTIADVTNLQTTLDGKSDTWHSHNDLYYTESEVDTALAGKANSTHTHNTNIAWLTFDLADNLTFSSSNSSVTITPTQDVDGNINLNLQSAASASASPTLTLQSAYTYLSSWSLPRSAWFSPVDFTYNLYTNSGFTVDLAANTFTPSSSWRYQIVAVKESSAPNAVTSFILDLQLTTSPWSSNIDWFGTWRFYEAQTNPSIWTTHWNRSHTWVVSLTWGQAYQLRYYMYAAWSSSITSTDVGFNVFLHVTKIA